MQSLQNISLDAIIYSRDYTTIMQLPTSMLKLIDERDRQICETKKYKNHFSLSYMKEDDDDEFSY